MNHEEWCVCADWVRLAEFRIQFDILQLQQRILGSVSWYVYLSDFFAVV